MFGLNVRRFFFGRIERRFSRLHPPIYGLLARINLSSMDCGELTAFSTACSTIVYGSGARSTQHLRALSRKPRSLTVASNAVRNRPILSLGTPGGAMIE